jgi:release factor glutamine methyltransferase
VVSNPPYIASREIAALEAEVREHDPRLALDGGEDGFDAYRSLARQLPDLLARGGIGVLEIGIGQSQSVPAILESAGLRVVAIRPDLSAIPRALVVQKCPPDSLDGVE